jgi:hypothetical protein
MGERGNILGWDEEVNKALPDPHVLCAAVAMPCQVKLLMWTIWTCGVSFDKFSVLKMYFHSLWA